MKIIIFGVGILRDIIIFAVFYYLAGIWQIEYLRTFIFAILGVKSLLGIFSIRSFKLPIWRLNPLSNKYLIGAVGASLGLLFLGVEWRPLQILLSTTGLEMKTWLAVFGVGIFNILLIEAVKMNFAKKVSA